MFVMSGAKPQHCRIFLQIVVYLFTLWKLLCIFCSIVGMFDAATYNSGKHLRLTSKHSAPSSKWRMISDTAYSVHVVVVKDVASGENLPLFSPSVGVCAKLHGLTLIFIRANVELVICILWPLSFSHFFSS